MLIDDSKNGLVVNQFTFLGVLFAFVAVMVLGRFYRQIHDLEGLLAVGWFLSLLLAMERDLFSLISGEHAQALVGGAGSQPSFVATWHGGIGAPDHPPEGGDNNAGIVADSGGLIDGGANNLHGFADAAAGDSGVNPVG